MLLSKALTLSIGSLEEPVITQYRLAVIVHHFYRTKSFQGEGLRQLQKDRATVNEFNHVVRNLLTVGILQEHPNFGRRAFRILGRKDPDPIEIACTIDPFCFVSHLSAMSHHGLTNRLPAKLFVSSPAPKQWLSEASNLMSKDLGDDRESYLDAGMPKLTRLKLQRIDRVDIHRFSSIHHGAYRNVRDRQMRVATLGRTFLDMLRNPDLCGGMQHVLEVWEEHAPLYRKAIVSEFDRSGGPIDKVRAGYILNERLGLEDPTLDSWLAFVTRGGSRKLDPSEEYRPQWSDKWCLSLNI